MRGDIYPFAILFGGLVVIIAAAYGINAWAHSLADHPGPTSSPAGVVYPWKGTPVGKTPVVGYVLDCSDGEHRWLSYSVVEANNVNDWPPSEECH